MGNAGPQVPNDGSKNEFIEACKKGEMDKINEMIKRGVNVNCHDEDSQATALMWACYQGHLNVVSRLLSLNNAKELSELNSVRINIEDRDKDGYTALHWAVIHKQPEVVKLLLSQGNADVNAKNKDLETPLHKASQYGLIEIAKTLLSFNALPNLKNKINKTPLDKARNADMRKLLTSLGAKSGNASGNPQEGEDGKEEIGENENEQDKHELLERGMIDNEMVMKQQWREEVRDWFKQMALSEYTDLFLEHGYDRLDIIMDLNDDELKQLGIKPGHVKVISKAIADIKAKKAQQKDNSVSDAQINASQPPLQQILSDNEKDKVQELDKDQDKVNDKDNDDKLPKENEPGQE